MNRLVHRLEDNRSARRKSLSMFLTAGYPTIGSTVPLAVALGQAGADVIELGIPFSDPIADGPVIQLSSEVALQNGMTVQRAIEMAREIRAQTDVPIVAMGYSNPIYAFGFERFLDRCLEFGIDGTIIPDLPIEEGAEFREAATERDLASIYLAAPTTPPDRLVQLDQLSTGFLYAVSVTGVTGEQQSLTSKAEKFLDLARSCVKRNPLLVGFGISTPDDARTIALKSDGVIIGSALVKILRDYPSNHSIDRANDFVRSMRSALDSLGR